MSTCRFCHGWREDAYGLMPKLMYGPRHYAHPDCYLKAKGLAGLLALRPYQQKTFPYFALKRHGLIEALEKLK